MIPNSVRIDTERKWNKITIKITATDKVVSFESLLDFFLRFKLRNIFGNYTGDFAIVMNILTIFLRYS